jgi:hypothetical protein
MDEVVKIGVHYLYIEFVFGAELMLQSLFVSSLHAETGVIHFKGWCPLK